MRGIRALAILSASTLLAAQPVAAQVTVVPSETVAQRLLDAQNAERVRLGLRPFTWSAKLAEHARKWAQTLATSDMFEHSPVGADGGEGENLWYGTKGDYSPEEMIGFFVDEGKQFKRSTFPDVSTTGDWQDVGHYTQIVWKDTREVGCTIASNTVRDFLVCRYAPAGNVVGQPVFDYNRSAQKAVAAPAGKTSGKQEVIVDVIREDHGRLRDPLAGMPPPELPQATPSKPKKRASKKRRRGG